jgi:predicted O-methyltransferase YrrM
MHLEWRAVARGTGPAILTSVAAEEAEELYELADDEDVLEIGAAYGYSAVTMALGGATEITSVDPHGGETWLGDTLSVMRSNLDAYNVGDRVEIIQGYSQDIMPRLRSEGRRYGLIFIDGDHRAASAEHDITEALQLIKPGGVIAVHDYMETCCCPEVQYATDRMFPDGPDRVVGTMFVIRR